MSKFFKGDESSSSEESTSESGSSSGSESEEEKPKQKQNFQRDAPAVRKPRKAQSAKDRRYDEMKDTIKNLKNAQAINDWNAISSEFQKINQQLAKAQQLIATEGVPSFYIAAMAKLADLVENTVKDKEKVKKMSKTNAKSLNAMKQNIKKNNQQYENEIAKYLETPEEEEAAEAAESDSDSDSENESGSSSSDSESEDEAKKKKDGSDSDSGSESGSDSDSDWGSDSSSSSSDEDPAMAGKTGMSKWMKTPGQEDSDDEFETVKKPKEKKERVIRAPKEEKVQEEKPKEQMVLNEENVKKKLEEMIAQRGRKGTSRKEQMQQLELLATAKISPSMTAQVLVHLIAAQFDSSITRGGVIHMPVSFEVTETDGDKTITRESRDNCVWTRCMGNIEKLLTVLKENPELTEDATGQASSAANKEAQQQAQAMMDEDDDEQPMVVAANLVGFLERLDDELYLSLRMTDNHSADFLRRLLDIAPLLALAEKVQMYYVEIGNNAVAARVAMRRLEHLYYKHNDIVALAAKTRPQEGDRADNRSAYIEDIAMHLYRYGDDTIKTRTMLCHIYYLALHDDFYRARDMMLMSHLQETISKHPVPAMILFNRTMAQLGLSAFRNGLIQEAHGCFDELCSNNRLKELLAQGLTNQRYGDKTQEQERAEKRRQTPYHMHINLELIECCHLVGAILIEIPEMVANAYDTKRKVSSRALRRVFENSDRNPLAGPPENTRDVIMTGARALEKGDWQSCEKFVLGLPVWTHLGNEECVAKALAVMRQKIKEEALRTFLFAYSAYYEALSLNQLCEMFDLTKKTVNSLVSKMIFSDELYASWDQPTASIVMHKKERSRLHHMALNYADQLGKLVDHNEKAWDNRFGGYGYKEQRELAWKRDREAANRGGRGGGRGGRGGPRGERGNQGGGDRREFGGDRN